MKSKLAALGILTLAVVVGSAIWLGSDDGGGASPQGASIAAESPEGFLPVFSAAIRTGDERFLFDRLHPAVVEFYGEQACRVYLRDFIVPDSEFRFVAAADPAQFTWVVDGRATLIPDVVDVDVTAVSEDGEIDRVIHLGLVEGYLRWFADCGDPVM
ncbi:MAG TPA: hypothetical protein VJ913_09325 [Actinomycetota bacterium]|nr:hypothetical protein [Actinomycetota bacterium]